MSTWISTSTGGQELLPHNVIAIAEPACLDSAKWLADSVCGRKRVVRRRSGLLAASGTSCTATRHAHTCERRSADEDRQMPRSDHPWLWFITGGAVCLVYGLAA
jgi:hypothetical protein